MVAAGDISGDLTGNPKVIHQERHMLPFNLASDLHACS